MNRIDPNDPRLTAYALDEMERAAHAEFEVLLQADPAARAVVEEIRSAAGLLGAALEKETGPTPGGNPDLAAAARRPAAADPYPRKAAPGGLLRFPQLYYVTAGLAAACFAAFFVVRESRERSPALPVRKGIVQHEANERFAGPAATISVAVVTSTDLAAAGQVAMAPAGASVEDRFFAAAETTTSTFPLRVGRAGYDGVRAQLQRGQRPARATVQVAEMINAFRYSYPEPPPDEAFASVLEEAESPWSPDHRLVRVGLKGRGDATGVIAREARVEVDFNPARVRAWRLIGFERDGDTMSVRGASVGDTLRPGDAVTALYEVVPAAGSTGDGAILLTLSLRYTEPGSGEARVYERTLAAGNTAFENASADFKFAAAVATFGLRLKESRAQVPVALDQIAQWAEAGSGNAPERREFVGLVQQAQTILRE